jgi:hypothetical protein
MIKNPFYNAPRTREKKRKGSENEAASGEEVE